MLEVLLARVGRTDSAPGALCQAGAETKDAAVSTVLAEAAVRVAVLAVGTCGHALEGLVVEEVAMTAASVGSAVVRSTHTCDAVGTAEVALVAQNQGGELAVGTEGVAGRFVGPPVIGSRIQSKAGQAVF